MSSEEEKKSPITPIPSDAYSSIGVRAIAEATTITLGVMALAPLLECLMSHMGASSEARRQAVAQSNNTDSIKLAHLGRMLSQTLGEHTGIDKGSDKRSDNGRNRGPDLAVS
jgi:hypothetical protein